MMVEDLFQEWPGGKAALSAMVVDLRMSSKHMEVSFDPNDIDQMLINPPVAGYVAIAPVWCQKKLIDCLYDATVEYLDADIQRKIASYMYSSVSIRTKVLLQQDLMDYELTRSVEKQLWAVIARHVGLGYMVEEALGRRDAPDVVRPIEFSGYRA